MKKTKKAPKRILNCIPSMKTEQDWRLKHAVEAGVIAAAPTIPSSKDLRASWWGVGNQLDTGSCVGWATADSVLRWHFVKANRLTAKELLSPRYIWMAAKETDEFRDRATTFIELEGTSLKAALDIARNYGAALESSLPFKPEHLFQDSANAFYALAAQRKIASYFNLQDSDAARRLQGWRAWIATHGPILTRLDVDATWDDAKATHGALAVYQASTARGGHAVALVGYTPTTFIVRNSWGTSDWGDNGFGYASLDYAKAAFNESYGVTL